LVGVPVVREVIMDGQIMYTAQGGVYLVWDAQEGATGYYYKIYDGEILFDFGTITGYEYLQPGMTGPAYWIYTFDVCPWPTYEEALEDAKVSAECGLQIAQGIYTWDIDPVCDYHITMDFEYMAGEPPVITAKGEEKRGTEIILDPAEINPTESGTLQLKVQIKDGNGNLRKDQKFILRIYPADDNPAIKEAQWGGHAHAVDGGEGRPLVKIKLDRMNFLDRNNILTDEYYRVSYEAEKSTYSAGTYTATFVPHSTAARRGTIPYGGIIRFEVECNGVKQTKDLVVKVPNLVRLSPSDQFPPYKLEGGTDAHPGPPLHPKQNWNHYGTASGVKFLDNMGRRFYYEVSATKRRLCYNDMLLIYGGNFEASGTFWKILPTAHQEHTGHSNFGETNCDMNIHNLTDSDLEWISNYVLDKTKDKVTIEPNSGRDIIHDESAYNHWHFRLYENLMISDEEVNK